MRIELTDDAQVRLEVPVGVDQEEYLFKVMNWCIENGISTYVIGVWEEREPRRWVSAWCILNPAHRTFFSLKWVQ